MVLRGSFGPLNSRPAFFPPRSRRTRRLSRRLRPPSSTPKPRTERKRPSTSTSACIIEYRVRMCRRLSPSSVYSRRRPRPAISRSTAPPPFAVRGPGPVRHYSSANPAVAHLPGFREARYRVIQTRCASGRRPS